MTTTKLCVKCKTARDDELCFSTPAHLVRPKESKRAIFYRYGMAECPTCGAVCHRDRSRIVLFERPRVIPVLIKNRKSSNKVIMLRRSEK